MGNRRAASEHRHAREADRGIRVHGGRASRDRAEEAGSGGRDAPDAGTGDLRPDVRGIRRRAEETGGVTGKRTGRGRIQSGRSIL